MVLEPLGVLHYRKVVFLMLLLPFIFGFHIDNVLFNLISVNVLLYYFSNNNVTLLNCFFLSHYATNLT